MAPGEEVREAEAEKGPAREERERGAWSVENALFVQGVLSVEAEACLRKYCTRYSASTIHVDMNRESETILRSVG